MSTAQEIPVGAEQPAPAAPATPPAPNDYEARIRTDPEFALGEVKKLQATNTKLYQKQKSVEPLTQLADQLGGAEQARNFILEYDGVLKHSDVARVAEHYRKHGVLPTANGQRSETQFDELFPDPQREEIQNLTRVVSELKQQVSQTRGTIGKQNVSQMLGRLRDEHPDGFQEYIIPVITEAVERWEKTPQGRDLLAQLDYDQLQTLAGKAVMAHANEIYKLRHERELIGLKRGATGAPSPTLSTGREPAPKSPGYTSFIQALADFGKVDPEGPLGRR